MKHPLNVTLKLLFWISISSILIAFSLNKFVNNSATVPIENPFLLATVLIIALIAGTLFWLKFGKHKKLSVMMFALGMGVGLGKASVLYGANIWFALIIMFSYGMLLELMSRDKNVIKEWYVIHNIVMIIVLVTIGGILGSFFPAWIAITLFLLFAIYDAWAVWKTKHMIKMAEQFINNGIIPGIVIPYKKKFGLLGGGDIFVIAFVASTLANNNLFREAYFAIIGMTLAVWWLFLFTKKNKYYPALPYIFAGYVFAMLVSAISSTMLASILKLIIATVILALLAKMIFQTIPPQAKSKRK